MIRALLASDIPYADAAQMPLHVASAFLSDERLNNTRHNKPEDTAKQTKQATQLSSSGITYVATKRKHSVGV
ncbi:hypothetical protein [Acinetobacter bereziniae]|uniref:hypothetical protein n=1 Tax=Acinetobacter bereziniae TaxID=106648 RepID=UPI00300BCDF0